MASYLLLRSNKETGPYNLDDLVKVGLKPYDLVWVQGKSAAWRYPSEVEELKPYAPTVEEQPYDRFYKKNTTPAKEETITQQPSYQKTEQPTYQKATVAAEEEQPLFEEKYAKYIPKTSVFVTLPGQKSAVAVQKPPVKEPVPVSEPTILVTENPVAQVKYSQPLDEIKEMYVKTLQDRKQKIARKSFLLSSLKKAGVIAGLVLSGLLAGYLLKSNSGNKPVTANQPALANPVVPSGAVAQTQEVISTQQNAVPPVTINTQPAEPATEKNTLPPAAIERLLKEEQKQYLESKSKKTPVEASLPANRSFEQQQPARSIENNPVTGERMRQVRNGANTNIPSDNNTSDTRQVVKPGRKTGLERLVSVSSNDYKRVAFGGIRNLELTVTNDSKYTLDKVTVELQYLKPNELPFRTETVQFHTVSANGSSTLRIPDTNRGIKVLYKIVDIQSMQSETALSGF